MCEEAPIAVYCVGYALPVGCCLAGIGLSCIGCYRYYNGSCVQNNRRRHQEPRTFTEPQIFTGQQIIKRNTLKKKITEAFKKSLKSSNQSDAHNSQRSSSPNKDISLKDMKDTCIICISEYNTDTRKEFIGQIKNCGHYFHFECIWQWLERKRDCPICREKCELSEADLRGISLQQALEMSCHDITVPGTSKVATKSSSNTSTLSSINFTSARENAESGNNIVITTQPDIYIISHGHNNSSFIDNENNASLAVSTDRVGDNKSKTEVSDNRRHSEPSNHMELNDANDEGIISQQPQSVLRLSKMFENIKQNELKENSPDS